jgi:hypothetical protein
MDLQEVGCGDMDWIEMAQDRDRWSALLNAVTHLRVQWCVDFSYLRTVFLATELTANKEEWFL